MGRKLQTTRFKNAKVFYRIFPMVMMQWQYVKILEDMKTIYMRYLQDFGIGKEETVPSYWKFETDGVFYNNTQEEIYDTVMSEVLERVIKGCNAVILCYGQTGSGKSLTASGLQNSFKDRGIAPRVISDLFKMKESLKSQKQICIQMSYIETKKMYINDLLNPANKVFDNQILKNIKTVKVKDERTAMKMLFIAEGRRQFSNDFLFEHAANGVLTLHVISKPLNHSDPVIKTSKIHVIDLAGADTCGNFTCLHKNVFEIGNANLAKSQLEQFVMVLCQNIQDHDHVLAKQRLNVLIQYLGDSLSDKSILRCIGHVRTDRENLLVTISMLRFGQIIRGLRPQRLQQNIMKEKEIKIDVMQKELKQMKIEKDVEIMLMNNDLSSNITQERLKHMQNVATEYLQNKTNELVLLNVTDANTVLKVFKDLYNKLEAEKIECTKLAYQRACEDALMDPKAVLGKMESAKSSRRSSLKAKESGTNTADPLNPLKKPARKLSKTNGPQRARSISSTGADDKGGKAALKSQDHASTSKLLKRSRTSSASVPKTPLTTGKRRSGSSTATTGTDGIGLIMEEVCLPKAIPQHSEAWNAFVIEDDYREILNTASMYKENAQESHREYLNEIKILQKYQEMVDLRKFELQKAQMLRLFNKEEHDVDGNVITSDLEKLCVKNLTQAQEQLVKQQERTLKSQTEFCIILETYQNAKNTINEKFDQYCQEKFHTSAPNLQTAFEKTTDKNNEFGSITEEEEITKNTQKTTEIEYFENLKHLMEHQIRKKINQRIKTKTWVQSCKR